jgi:hypothetical protein
MGVIASWHSFLMMSEISTSQHFVMVFYRYVACGVTVTSLKEADKATNSLNLPSNQH